MWPDHVQTNKQTDKNSKQTYRHIEGQNDKQQMKTMGEGNAAERAALSGTPGSLQPEFEQNFNCEQSLNKV